MKNTTENTLNLKWTCPADMGRQVHLAYMGKFVLYGYIFLFYTSVILFEVKENHLH